MRKVGYPKFEPGGFNVLCQETSISKKRAQVKSG